MDFRPNTNTLVANYLVTFGIVGLIVYMSIRPGNVVTYYYSPEYNSHASYGTSNCASCHTTAWAKVTDKNCSTAGCHTDFQAGQPTTPERLATNKDEFGNARPHFGSILAFHDKVIGQTSCESCHPSHRLPQKGRFNNETMLASLEQSGGIPTDPAVLTKKRADAFHHGAELMAGKMSCNACHAGMGASGEASASASAAAIQQMAPASGASHSEVTPIAPLTDSEPAAEPPSTVSAPSSPNIAHGDLTALPAMNSNNSSSSSSAATGSTHLPNLFEAAHKAAQEQQNSRQDGAAEMPN